MILNKCMHTPMNWSSILVKMLKQTYKLNQNRLNQQLRVEPIRQLYNKKA